VEPIQCALVVDDDGFQRRLLVRLLKELGVPEVAEADNGITALQAFRSRQDLLICDLEMPEMDGLELLAKLAELRVATSVVITSAHDASVLSAAEAMAKADGMHFLGTLPKPVSKEALLNLLVKRQLEKDEPATLPLLSGLDSSELRTAFDAGWFEPFFQPKVELVTGQVCGAEALARLAYPGQGILAPSAFIDLLEQHGLMDQLTWTMLSKAMAVARVWKAAGNHFPVSVNLSISCTQNTKLPGRVIQLLREQDLEPEDLIIEVTESLATANIARSVETLTRLRIRGIGLSIDDFGTGYSSFEQLARIPFTELKIDRSFIRDATVKAERRALLESSIDIARRLSLITVAEGVELPEDLELLRELGCRIGQGYLIAKPMGSEEFLDWLGSWRGFADP
jgi:EAL domain-containing protein (putative c-di-GMP-specific phosphodiesterase class I)/ActR/RegA family two-component response regulator